MDKYPAGPAKPSKKDPKGLYLMAFVLSGRMRTVGSHRAKRGLAETSEASVGVIQLSSHHKLLYLFYKIIDNYSNKRRRNHLNAKTRRAMERIKLTKESIKKLFPDDLIAITIAESGAMGDPDAIELVDKDLNLYYTHFGEIEESELERVIPFLKTLQLMFGNIEGLDKNWVGLYIGYGNYLFVRPELKEPILQFVEENYSDTEVSLTVELYSHWYDALKAIKTPKD